MKTLRLLPFFIWSKKAMRAHLILFLSALVSGCRAQGPDPEVIQAGTNALAIDSAVKRGRTVATSSVDALKSEAVIKSCDDWRLHWGEQAIIAGKAALTPGLVRRMSDCYGYLSKASKALNDYCFVLWVAETFMSHITDSTHQREALQNLLTLYSMAPDKVKTAQEAFDQVRVDFGADDLRVLEQKFNQPIRKFQIDVNVRSSYLQTLAVKWGIPPATHGSPR